MTGALALCLLLLLGGAVIGWQLLHSLHERAIAIAASACREAGLQLLDATVSRQTLRLGRSDGVFGWIVDYGFDVSADGHSRVQGRLRFLSGRLAWIDLPRGPSGSDLWMAPSSPEPRNIGQDR